MSREIKFRAWDRENKRMFDIARFDFADYTVYPHLFGGGVLAENCDIMEYTGLTDKNGAEIYEGDIFKAPHDFGPGGYSVRTGVVSYDNIRGYQWNYWLLDELEVIGNIYENPDLLEKA